MKNFPRFIGTALSQRVFDDLERLSAFTGLTKSELLRTAIAALLYYEGFLDGPQKGPRNDN